MSKNLQKELERSDNLFRLIQRVGAQIHKARRAGRDHKDFFYSPETFPEDLIRHFEGYKECKVSFYPGKQGRMIRFEWVEDE